MADILLTQQITAYHINLKQSVIKIVNFFHFEQNFENYFFKLQFF